MIYNIVLFSKIKNTFYQKVKSFDGRPLRFTDYAYAERETHERNIRHQLPDEDGLIYVVVQEYDV